VRIDPATRQLKSWERLSDRSGDLLGTLVRALGRAPAL
jgi:hypothetical protein